MCACMEAYIQASHMHAQQTSTIFTSTQACKDPLHPMQIDEGYLSAPEAVQFPTEGGKTAYLNYYAPKNKDFSLPPEHKPPLLIKIHGGPTSQASTGFNLALQFWTSRGRRERASVLMHAQVHKIRNAGAQAPLGCARDSAGVGCVGIMKVLIQHQLVCAGLPSSAYINLCMMMDEPNMLDWA